MPLLAVGIVACLQTHGSRANWHPHLHLLVTDGGFRPDATFVSWPAHDTARLTEAFRRAVLVRIVALRALEQAGFSVVTAADGREALALIAQHGPPDLVATDNVVSAVGGQELARQLSARWPDLPIVFLSAYAPDELFPASSERNHSATIQKPFTAGQLTSSVIKTSSYRLAH